MSKQMLADRPGPGNKGGRKRREIVPIPDDAPKMPSYDEMSAKIEGVKSRIEIYKKDTESLKTQNDQLGGESDERKESREEVKKLRTQKSELLTDLSGLRSKNRAIAEEARNTEREIRDVAFELRKEQKGKTDLLEPGAIDKKIKELEFKIESGGVGSLKGEKRVMQEIKQLNLMREKAKELMAKGNGILDAKSRADKSRDERDSNQKKIDSLTDELTAVIDRMTAVKASLDASSTNDERAKIRTQKDNLRTKINKCFEEMNKIRDEHKAKKEAYFKWKEDYDKLVEAEIKKQREEREKRDKEDEEKRKLDAIEYEELKRLNPFEVEIRECSVLVDYLKRKADLKHTFAVPAAKKADAAGEFDAAKAMTRFEGKGAIQLGRKDDSADFFQMPKKGKKVSKPKAAATTTTTASKKPVAEVPAATKAPKRLTHDHNKEEVFRKYGFKLPQFTNECKPMIKTLEDKIEEYKTHIKTPAQLAEERKTNAAADAAKKAAEAATKNDEE